MWLLRYTGMGGVIDHHGAGGMFIVVNVEPSGSGSMCCWYAVKSQFLADDTQCPEGVHSHDT